MLARIYIVCYLGRNQSQCDHSINPYLTYLSNYHLQIKLSRTQDILFFWCCFTVLSRIQTVYLKRCFFMYISHASVLFPSIFFSLIFAAFIG